MGSALLRPPELFSQLIHLFPEERNGILHNFCMLSLAHVLSVALARNHVVGGFISSEKVVILVRNPHDP